MEMPIDPKSAYKVLIVSDTHGVIDARVLALASACDAAIHGGDIGGVEVLTALGGAVNQLASVRGNNDVESKWLGDVRVLRALPERALLELPGGTIGVVHGDRHGSGDRRHRRLRLEFSDCRAVVYGHSHKMIMQTGEQPWILNPGAAGHVRTYGGPSCMVVEVDTAGKWSVLTHRFNRRA
ncbi:MAG: metallophosphoesterase family protein [Chromatiales bacterium]|jgi:uncharacterized protein|nr:metallophosphoesterase family protein [Chromatiales bacterium]